MDGAGRGIALSTVVFSGVLSFAFAFAFYTLGAAMYIYKITTITTYVHSALFQGLAQKHAKSGPTKSHHQTFSLNLTAFCPGGQTRGGKRRVIGNQASTLT
jgi:hypothetical protein